MFCANIPSRSAEFVKSNTEGIKVDHLRKQGKTNIKVELDTE